MNDVIREELKSRQFLFDQHIPYEKYMASHFMKIAYVIPSHICYQYR